TRSILAALLAAFVLTACGPDYVKENATDEQYKRDSTACNSFVGEMMSKERGINMDREATMGGIDSRQGRVRLPQQMAQRSDTMRSDKLMDMCMQQRGWTAKRNDWLPF
ncbi:unnamed protein product, partial [Phaeothamnion confervicola]